MEKLLSRANSYCKMCKYADPSWDVDAEEQIINGADPQLQRMEEEAGGAEKWKEEEYDFSGEDHKYYSDRAREAPYEKEIEQSLNHGEYCNCTDCAEASDQVGEIQDYDDWKKAFPNLPWND